MVMQPDPTTLYALADRVEAGEEGGAIEVEIEEALYEKPRMPPPNITESLDAIEALRERLLPDVTAVEVYSRGRLTRWFAEYSWLVGDDEITGTSRIATTERHARLAALLRALAAKVEGEGEHG